ncbi:unnamed protein product [Closterium sp. NIES-54]
MLEGVGGEGGSKGVRGRHDDVFYKTMMSLEVWKSEHGPASGRTQVNPPTDTSTATLPLLAEVGELADEDAEVVRPSSPSPAPPAPPLVADLLTSTSASGYEKRSGASPVAPARSIASGRRDVKQVGVGVKSTPTGEQQVEEVQPTLVEPAKEVSAEKPPTGEQSAVMPTQEQSTTGQSPGEKLAGTPTVVQQNAEGSEAERQPAEQAQQGAVHVPIDGTDQVCKLLKSMYGLKQLPLLWYKALDYVLMGVGWKKSQVDQALYFKVGGDGMACWVLVYVDDLLAASSSTVLLKELLEASFKRHEISPVEKYLGLEIVHDWTARKPWLHQQAYVDKLHRRFIDKENTERTPKTPVSVNAYAELKFDDTETQERQEEDYRPKVGSLQFAATTTRPDIAFMCSKLGSSFTVRSNQVDHCLAYLANTRNTAVEFGGGPDSLKLVGYVDTDDAGEKHNRTSTGGYVFVYGGAAIS